MFTSTVAVYWLCWSDEHWYFCMWIVEPHHGTSEGVWNYTISMYRSHSTGVYFLWVEIDFPPNLEWPGHAAKLFEMLLIAKHFKNLFFLPTNHLIQCVVIAIIINCRQNHTSYDEALKCQIENLHIAANDENIIDSIVFSSSLCIVIRSKYFFLFFIHFILLCSVRLWGLAKWTCGQCKHVIRNELTSLCHMCHLRF